MQPPSTTFMPYPQPGEVLDGKYRIERLLGEGGMGAVAKATHLVRRAPVALKFISGAILSFPGAIERFVNEGVAASQIDSDHVVKVFDVGRLPSGAPYLVMEFLDGRDLGDLLASEGPRLLPARAVHFALQMLRALQTAHNAGIVHRDMKPSNCFVVEKDGEPDFVKLVDFGISKVRSSDDRSESANLTRTNSALGTPLYMSPEQARSPRDVDHRSDLYSVGAILYEMLGGRTPYTSETGEYTEILFKIFTTEPEPLGALSPEIPEGLAAVVHRALMRDRDARYGSALDMAEALAPFADARSATLLARLRAVRGRSASPSAPASLAPTSFAPSSLASASATPPRERAAAVRVVSAANASEPAPRAPSVPTDIGLTRDTAPQKHTARNAALVVVVAAVFFAAIGATGILLLRSSLHARIASPTNVNSAAAAAPTAIGHATAGVGQGIVPTDPPVVGLSPLPSSPLPERPPVSADVPQPGTPATPSTMAAPSAIPPEHRVPPAAAPQGPPPTASVSVPAASAAAPALPKQLSDLKLH